MNRFVVVIVLIALFGLAKMLMGQNIGWSLVNDRIQREFPEVARISTSELAARMADSARDKPLLLDVRTQAEFEVSHLAGAQRVEPRSDPKLLSISREKSIVTYCSVGYRSAAFAQKMRAAGYEHVANLEGSIFQWANEGRPLFHEGQPTDKVHPYNSVWGLLLDGSHRAK